MRTYRKRKVGDTLSFALGLPADHREIRNSRAVRSLTSWPPDIFAIAAYLLQDSGAYSAVVSDDHPDLKPPNIRREKFISRVADAWRVAVVQRRSPPAEVARWWKTVQAAHNLELDRVHLKPRLVAALLNLLASADTCCAGAGMSDVTEDRFLNEIAFSLVDSGLKTLCRNIEPGRIAVLPKMHTPQNGLTIRSFSHNLALIRTREIVPEWHPLGPTFRPETAHVLNLLLVPWPFSLHPSQLKASRRVKMTDEVGRGGYGLFTVQPGAMPDLSWMKKILRSAERAVGPVHGVVLPELALSDAAFDRLANGLVTDNRFLISGVGRPARDRKSAGENYARFEFAFPGEELLVGFRQHKHHRWRLDKNQIFQYHIGSGLHPEANWWEHIELKDRTLKFVNLRKWLTIAMLICEDLARPDPVGDLVRAVGPNLVITLLMDGPQLGSRWPGRHAIALADDPGCSVLALTSAGMADLSRPRGCQPSRVVALWRDSRAGTVELALPLGAAALMINITVKYEEEWTADGRGDHRASGYPILAGYHPISV